MAHVWVPNNRTGPREMICANCKGEVQGLGLRSLQRAHPHDGPCPNLERHTHWTWWNQKNVFSDEVWPQLTDAFCIL